jgi:hypothetical protein
MQILKSRYQVLNLKFQIHSSLTPLLIRIIPPVASANAPISAYQLIVELCISVGNIATAKTIFAKSSPNFPKLF